MAGNTADQPLPILREELTPNGGHPGMLLSDQQIMALPLYHRVIADQDLVSFHAVANGHETAARPRPVFDTNVANFERVVRAHIDARATANADTIALPVSPTPVTQSASNTCPIVNADAEALPTQDVPTTDQAPDAARMAGTNTLALPAPGSYAASFTARPVGPTAVPPHATTSTMRVARAATTRLVSQASARLAGGAIDAVSNAMRVTSAPADSVTASNGDLPGPANAVSVQPQSAAAKKPSAASASLYNPKAAAALREENERRRRR